MVPKGDIVREGQTVLNRNSRRAEAGNYSLRYETIIMRGFARLFDVDEEHAAIGDAFSIFN